MLSLYDLLGVPPEASADQIRAAYRSRMRLIHPDRVAEKDRDSAGALASQVNEAYRILSDPASRSRYDAEARAGGGSGPSAGPPPAPAPGPSADGPPHGWPEPPRPAAPPQAPVTLADLAAQRLVDALRRTVTLVEGADIELAEALLGRALPAIEYGERLLPHCLGHDEAATALAAEALGLAAAAAVEVLRSDRDLRERLAAFTELAAAAQLDLASGLRRGVTSHLTPWRYKGSGWPPSAVRYRIASLGPRS